MSSTAASLPRPPQPARTSFRVLGAISTAHLINDMMQSLILAIYPILKGEFELSFAQIGLITLTFQITASLLQPIVGYVTDKKPQPYALPLGMGCTLTGLLLLAFASTYPTLLLAAAMVGMGSSVFHPESSRVARLASGGRHGLAQSVFQVGGNVGSAIGPLMAAFVVLPRGQTSVAWFSLAALLAMCVLFGVANWYRVHRTGRRAKARSEYVPPQLSKGRVVVALSVLLALIFSKYFYTQSLTSYYTFYLIDRFHVSVQTSQILLFVYLGAFATGTLAGGPIGDRVGRKRVIWVSILGPLPFTLLLPHVDLFWTVILTVVIGIILSSAFSAILVYAQELVPGRVGMIAGLFFGLAFGMGGIGAAVLGDLADRTSVEFVYNVCAFLPAIGLLTALLPNLETARQRMQKSPAVSA
jgi:FSR family fosmidomycin resistance protein-like MFS transporter